MSRILYVEDDWLLQLDGEASLIEAGHEAILFTNGQMACDYLRQDDARYDALITDIDLRGDVQGWQIATASRAMKSNLPVIYVTGHAGRDFQKMGVSDSIMASKPFEWPHLLTSLSGLITAAEHNDQLKRGSPPR